LRLTSLLTPVRERAGFLSPIATALRTFALLWLAATAATPSLAQRLPGGIVAVQSVEGIDEYRLGNGLQLLLVPDDSKPTTTVNLTVHVGSRHENYGETGMAHLLEHMMFKGTPRRPRVWAEFEQRGLAANGSTFFDRTNYTASFSANNENLKWYVDWLADAMVNSFIARKDLDTEMTVVRNEMESGENSPSRILLQRTLAVMYDWHNYGHETIGARSDVENVDIPRLQAFYRQYYQTDNATLIVAGKFEVAKVLGWVARSFGALKKPARTLPRQYTLDPAQDGERSVTLRRVGGAPLVFAGYHFPPGPHPDFAAAEVLALVLGDVPSGRLHKRLTEPQLAASVFGFAQGLAEPSFMVLGAQLAPGQDADKASAEMLAVAEPVTAEELQRAKSKWRKAWSLAFTNPEAVGVALSESIAQGDWRLFFLNRDRVRDVSLADVQRVGEAYLRMSNRTLGVYLPTDKPVRAPAPARVDLQALMQDFKPAAAAARIEPFDATPANIDARTQRFDVGAMKVAVLPKATRGATVRASLTLRFGDLASLANQVEIADAVAALLDKGSRTLTRQQIQDRLDAIETEMGISAGATSGSVTVTLASRREHLADAVALAAELLRYPVFPPEALDELRRQNLTFIEQQRKEPDAIADNTLARQGNPYPRGDVRHARTFDEIAEDLNALTVEKLRAFHSRFYGVARAEFAASGDIDVAALRRALETGFGGWASAAPYSRVPQPPYTVPAERILIATPDKQNATMVAYQGLPLSDGDADYPALMLANHLLGGGGSSRLWKRVREREGLSYDVGSRISWGTVERHSEWSANAIFAPQNRAKVEVAFREEVARALKDGFSAQEVAEGQRGLLAFRRLSRAQDGTVASSLASNLYLNRSFAVSAQVDAALAKLTAAEVNAALRKHLRPESFVLIFAGDFKP
jgi:zinc protease